jgi:hypothetical protein
VESTFTIGFLNDLILITATVDQNFSAIAARPALLFKPIWPLRYLTRAGSRRDWRAHEIPRGERVHN